MKWMKPIAWIAFLLCTWLAFGAASLHQKDVAAGVRETSPAYHSLQTPLTLGAFAFIAVLVALFAKTGAAAPARIKI